ncbi:hypothetical protein F5B21DRAFT_219011 [Xylaria acuta]|nr:hypothetical protein F5B21DRAFT_219011 [Xylaria acuta]
MLGYEFALRLVDQELENGESHSHELIQYLRADSRSDGKGLPSPLNDVVQRFSEMIHSTKIKSVTDVVCFYETRPTNYLSILKALDKNNMPKEVEFDPTGHAITVPRASACIDGITALPLHVRHNMLHKHNSPTSTEFELIVRRHQGFAEKKYQSNNIMNYVGRNTSEGNQNKETKASTGMSIAFNGPVTTGCNTILGNQISGGNYTFN